jgi:hypothetical protein
MAAASPAYIAGFTPFADKGVVTSIPGTPKETAAPAAAAAAAISGTMMPDSFIGYYKTVVFQTEPFAAFGTTAVTKPIYDRRSKE